MNKLVLFVILSHCCHGNTQETTATNAVSEHNGPETGSASFAMVGSTEANILNPTVDAALVSEIDNINFVPEGTSATSQTKQIPYATAPATEKIAMFQSDTMGTDSPDMVASSATQGAVTGAPTHSPLEKLDMIQTATGNFDSTLKTTASASTESPLVEPTETDLKVRSRSSRQTLYSNAALSSSRRRSTFETTRGKNWCAYVHTRLSPSVVTDNVETFISAVKDPCAAKMGGCPIRYQMVTRPAYRMKHKVVTSLEWKCCPGYIGEKCQLTVLRYQTVTHENQAESNNAINGGPSVDPQQSALLLKMTDQIYNQEMKLTTMQKKIENISSTMSELHNSVSSLEEKLNDDAPSKSVQAFLKDLKSKTITELVKDIVREQMKGFQTDMQETLAQLFKTMPALSVEVESTTESLKHLNKTVESISAHQKLLSEQDPTPTMADILELKTQIVHTKEEITSVCDSSLRDLHENQQSLAAELEREQLRSSTYYESLNTTLLKIRQVQDQLLSGEQAQDFVISTLDIPTKHDNVTECLMHLQDKVRRQSYMMVQLYEDISAQDSKINNFTITLELQKDSIQKACEARLSKCRKDFESKIKSTEEHVHVLNKTMSDVVLPLDDKIDKMNEQINDLCYDMEILQPLIEQGAPFSMTNDYGHQNDVTTVNRQLEEINAVVYGLTSNIQDLTKGQEALRADAQAQDQIFERRVAGCILDIEDGLNNTMTVLNNAIDFIQDNYVPKEIMSSLQNDSQLLTQTVQRLDSLLGLIPQFNQLNESVKMLADELLKKESALNSTEPLSSESANVLPYFKILNETAVKVDQCRENMSQLEEKLWLSNQGKLDCSNCLKRFESQISQMLANYTISTKSKNSNIIPKEKEQPAYPKYQELNSRVKALEAKSIRLSLSMPLLNKTVYENRDSCQRSFVMIRKVNDSMSQWIGNMQPNISNLQEAIKALEMSATEQTTEKIWSNLTAYIDKSTADVIGNVAKLQKQMKLVIKKTISPKPTQPNTATQLAGRSQRNSDSTSDQGDDSSSCDAFPCHNGGTCINDRESFVCACRHPFGGANCSIKMTEENTLAPDFSKGSYRYAPMVTFFVSHTYGMTVPGPIRFNNLYVNYGASYAPSTGKFNVPYLGVYVFKYTIETFSPRMSGYLVVDGVDKLAFQSESINSSQYSDRVFTGDAVLELNYGQQVWLRLATGSIPAKYPPVTTFGGFLLYRT